MTMTSIACKPPIHSALRFLITFLLLIPAGCAHQPAPVPEESKAEVQELVRTATTHEVTGEVAKSVEGLKIALTVDPENTKAREELNRLVAKQQAEAEAHFKAGAALRGTNPQKAHKEFIAAVKLRSNYPEALTALREIHLAEMLVKIKKRPDYGSKPQSGTHGTDPGDSFQGEYSLTTAIQAFDRGEYGTAIKEFTKMLDDYPGDPDITAYLEQSWYNSGVNQYNKKDYKKAVAAFKTVLEINPGNVPAKEYMENARKQLKTRKK
jgi:tetratricopeptide (TPR) repeat protein